jgi:hypothetical protein
VLLSVYLFSAAPSIQNYENLVGSLLYLDEGANVSAAASVTPRRKQPNNAESPRSSEPRRFEGKRFVALEETFVDALCEGCDSTTELKLVLQVMKLANTRETGNPFGWSEPIMLGELAKRVGCSRQYINCAAKSLFSETGIFERMEKTSAAQAGVIEGAGDSRAFAYRVRGEYWREWLKLRRAAHKRADADREKLRKKLEKPAAPAPYSLPSPVDLGPASKPFELPDAARDAIANCTAITAQRPGKLKHLSVDAKGVIVFDFDPAPAAAVDAPTPFETVKPIDNWGCRSPIADAENKRLIPPASDMADSAATAASLADRFREQLNAALLQRIGTPIDDAVFERLLNGSQDREGKPLPGLAPLSSARAESFLAILTQTREGRKADSWGFLPYLVTKALARVEAHAQLTHAEVADVSQRDLEYASYVLAHREESPQTTAADIAWAEQALAAAGLSPDWRAPRERAEVAWKEMPAEDRKQRLEAARVAIVGNSALKNWRQHATKEQIADRIEREAILVLLRSYGA